RGSIARARSRSARSVLVPVTARPRLVSRSPPSSAARQAFVPFTLNGSDHELERALDLAGRREASERETHAALEALARESERGEDVARLGHGARAGGARGERE